MRAYEITESSTKPSMGNRILPALAWALEKGAESIFWVITNPLKALSVAVVVTHPQGAWTLGNVSWNLIKDPVATSGILAKGVVTPIINSIPKPFGSGPWIDAEQAAKDLATITGGKLPIAEIEALAAAAVEYAIPIAGVVALLAGGTALYQYLEQNDALPADHKDKKLV